MALNKSKTPGSAGSLKREWNLGDKNVVTT